MHHSGGCDPALQPDALGISFVSRPKRCRVGLSRVDMANLNQMFRKTVVILSLLTVALTAGCTSKTSGNVPASPTANLSMQRKASLASQWQMNQIQVDVDPAGDLPILVKLNQGDKIDGYFYILSGASIAFSISGNSTFYQSGPDASGRVTSDRFSFSSTTDQGNTYSLDFKNNSGQKVSIFLEIIFPNTGSVFIPLAIK